jgi:ubiquinol-cytochrome c reductase cytochrome b subunit
LNCFFAFHVVAVPIVLLGLVVAHVLALHEVGSNNPDGVEIKKNKDANGIPKDGIPFHPYYTVKDIVGIGVFFIFFFAVIFFAPEMGGYFLEHANFVPADSLVTPEHIAPVWYFTPFYTVLRAVPDPFLGVIAMGAAVMILFFLPWIDRNPIKSWRYRSALHKFSILYFVVTFFVLGWLGMQAVTPLNSELGIRFTEVYFSFFLVLWFTSKPRPAVTHIIVFIIAMALILAWDFAWNRFAVQGSGMVGVSLLIPGVYLAVCLLGSMFSGLGKESPVPERVTG